jgi:hypothetical protein
VKVLKAKDKEEEENKENEGDDGNKKKKVRRLFCLFMKSNMLCTAVVQQVCACLEIYVCMYVYASLSMRVCAWV